MIFRDYIVAFPSGVSNCQTACSEHTATIYDNHAEHLTKLVPAHPVRGQLSEPYSVTRTVVDSDIDERH
jgi:hypothetical protein